MRKPKQLARGWSQGLVPKPEKGDLSRLSRASQSAFRGVAVRGWPWAPQEHRQRGRGEEGHGVEEGKRKNDNNSSRESLNHFTCIFSFLVLYKQGTIFIPI